MNTINGVESTAGFALLQIMLTGLVWVVLWSKRSPSVYAWCLAGLLGAGFLVVTLLGSTGPGLPELIAFPLLALFCVGSPVLRAWSLARLGRYPVPLRWIALFMAAITLLGLALALFEAGRGALATFVFSVANTAGLVTAWLAHRLAGKHRMLNLRLLSISVGLTTLLAWIAFFLAVFTGEEMLRVSPVVMPVFALVITMLLTVCNNGLYIGVIMDLSARREAEAEAVLARLQAEKRLMADLHDGFGTQLSIGSLYAARGELRPAEMKSLLDGCLMDLHLMVDTLSRSEGCLGNALRYLRHRLSGRLPAGSPRVHWDLDLDKAPELPTKVLLDMMRIVQEALNNALKHAGASDIHVLASYDRTKRTLQLAIQDNGRGIEPGVREGNGLGNMRERAGALGAELHIENAMPGTRVELAVSVAGSPHGTN